MPNFLVSLHPLAVLLLGLAAGGWLFLGLTRLLGRLDRARHRRTFAFCPLAVIELVSVPGGQEEAVRGRNPDLFTLEEARRMLRLYAPVAGDEIARLERLLGSDALRERAGGYLVRLGRRGFHG